MTTASVSVMLADIRVQSLGDFDAGGALLAFDSFSWAEEVSRVEQLENEGRDCVSPDMTFTVSPYHFTATVHESPNMVDVEICVPKRFKFLGIFPFRGTKFFQFEGISRREFEALLRAFLTIPENEQFNYFSQIQQA